MIIMLSNGSYLEKEEPGLDGHVLQLERVWFYLFFCDGDASNFRRELQGTVHRSWKDGREYSQRRRCLRDASSES